MKTIKRILALMLVAAILTTTAFAAEVEPAPAETPQPQEFSAWASSTLADLYSLGMWRNDYYYCILDPVTQEQLTTITDIVAAKLALLNLPARKADLPVLVLDGTRGAVINALYHEVAAYALPGVEADSAAFLTSLGIIKGDPATARVCTLQEALVMAQRLILAVYDSQNAGTKGLLWKATNGENTLYLLGTIHVDRGNIYPFHKTLRDAISNSETAIFEIDFGDVADLQALVAMQTYSDGTTLKDHVSAQVYADAVKAGEAIGLTQEQVAVFKPWAFANVLQTIGLSTGTENGGSGAEAPMVVDSYVYSSSVNLDHTIAAAESAVFQGTIFDTLSAEYQETFLSDIIKSYYGVGTSAGESSDSIASGVDAMLDAWKAGDVAAMTTLLDKEAILTSGDELSINLLLKRDPGMISCADTYLKQDGVQTGIMVVGAAHMIGSTGIVQGLLNLGYTVTPSY